MSSEQDIDDVDFKDIQKIEQKIETIRSKLYDTVEEYYSKEIIDSEEQNKIAGYIEQSKFDKARNLLNKKYEENSLEFESDEKTAFAEKFEETYEEINDSCRKIEDSISKLNDGVDRSDLVDYLFGKHSKLNKGDIRTVLNTIDELNNGSLSTKDHSRIISAFNSDLNISTVEKILESIE